MKTLQRTAGALALAASLVVLARPVHAEELRSDEGVAIDVPDGWQRCTTRVGVTTALAIEPANAPGAHRRLAINTLPISNATEEDAFKVVRESLERPGEIVERTTGRFLRVDFEHDAAGADGAVFKLKNRSFTAVRNKRVYCMVLESPAAGFDEDARVLDKVIEGVKFFVPEPKKAQPLPAPAPSPAPSPAGEAVRRDTPPLSPAKGPAPARPLPTQSPDSALTSTNGEKPLPPRERPDRSPPAAEKVPPRAPAETAPVTTPAAPAAPAAPVAPKPNLVRRPRSENLLGPGSLVAFDDEYNPELCAAKHLVDPAAHGGWCSSPSAHAPHRFVIELPQATDIARLIFDNACPDGFDGASAREVEVDGSSAGPQGPWESLARGSLEKAKNDQAVDLAPNQGRWLRVSIVSNHGHPVLCQLLRVRAYAAEVVALAPNGPAIARTDEGPFRLERVRLSLKKNGPALDPAVIAPGESLWVYFKPRALQLAPSGEYSFEVDLRFADAKGEQKHARLKVVDAKGRPPAPPLSTFVSLGVEIPATFEPGFYTLEIVARDREAQKEAVEKLAFEVKKAP